MATLGSEKPRSVITNEIMVASLRQACPEFAAAIDAFEADWAGKSSMPSYLLLNELADHVAGRLDRAETEGFSELFRLVERWLAEGDEYVREAATVGLIEDLQKASRYAKARPEALIAWLGPRARLAWEDVAAFWKNGTPIPDRSGRTA